MSTETDIIDLLAGIEAGSPLDGIRGKRVQARENAQVSYLTLFEPADFGDVSALERYAVAAFVAGVHGEPHVTAFYFNKLGDIARPEFVAALKTEIGRGKTTGPYGAFPAGPLSVENKPGLIYRVAPDHQRILGTKLAAALEHAHLLVFRPRDAAPADMQALLDASWTATGIVTLSQLVAFLSFQVRSVSGLRTLAASIEHQPSPAR
ncbi:CMD domain protein [Bradyrhizobium sp.]|uniref:CMD domain protein n=1 Tax=Bradyrhizobium sp. TaxID=376 RepID=UPI002D55EBAB|nr:CMD domain protein [Bradyrhizobium sp.]HZR73317.1 CMD domain protein [Bradyrhizobium sp.]